MDTSHASSKDAVLTYISSNKGTLLNSNFLTSDLGLDSSKALTILDELESEGMIGRIGFSHRGRFVKGDTFEIRPKGEEFLKSKNSFVKMYETEISEAIRRKDNQVIEDAKLRSDAKLSKWQVKTFWPVFFGGFIAGSTALVLELEDRYSKWQEGQSVQPQSEQLEVSTSSIDTPKQDAQYLHDDTLK